nr:sterol desaturase family protein [Alphaproteobacteria bacterium]
LTGLAELFYHWNIKTPYWLGFVVQRPESHCVHHQMGWHAQNYSDLPIWDMLFGTFHNPRTFDRSCGFEGNKELQLGEMLLGEDMHISSEEQP